MENVWFKPEGYQRTSKKLQLKCLELLLGFSEINGDILDIGCGTGNALKFINNNEINNYLGIDISSDMVEFARRNHYDEKINFIVDDFLNHENNGMKLYDAIICAACLHWFIPNERKVLDKIFNYLKPNGYLFLSCAFDFSFFCGEKDIQGKVLDMVRNKYPPVSEPVVFDDYRFNNERFKSFTKDFNIIKSYRIEESIDFSNYDDFRDWHLGSGSVIYQQFSKSDQKNAVNDFYQILYDKYLSNEHNVSYSTGLFLLQKRG
ncbi:MAG: class I SAM-dependent methyltransferase [Enterobacteriaceae bacterium]|jgi:SAM-dependent methyltransferase|nr:class I SAM-dependent methyltransferase [Enterobacteriaceae bacterium]